MADQVKYKNEQVSFLHWQVAITNTATKIAILSQYTSHLSCGAILSLSNIYDKWFNWWYEYPSSIQISKKDDPLQGWIANG